eukprot:EG_transcript_21802
MQALPRRARKENVGVAAQRPALRSAGPEDADDDDLDEPPHSLTDTLQAWWAVLTRQRTPHVDRVARARWDASAQCCVVTHRRGQLPRTSAVDAATGRLAPEEALYLVDRGSLVVSRDGEQPCSFQEVFELTSGVLAQSRDGPDDVACSSLTSPGEPSLLPASCATFVDAYTVYSHLRNRGWPVTPAHRHTAGGFLRFCYSVPPAEDREGLRVFVLHPDDPLPADLFQPSASPASTHRPAARDVFAVVEDGELSCLTAVGDPLPCPRPTPPVR